MRGCYTFSVVEYVKLGRKLGIGTRVAAKILRDRAQNGSPATPAKAPMAGVEPPAPAAQRPTTRATRQIDPRTAARNVSRGVARGSRGFWKPFARVARALWHEVTGVFFAIFALFFAQNLWRVRADWQSGPQHHRFIAYLIFMLVFTYFSITAFVHSRRTHH